jgi:two-component system, NarL family, invasion response regulator UvrY
MIKVLLADDHQILRDGLKQLLAEYDDIQVAGEASNGNETLRKIREEEWNIVVLDMSMPGKSGIELIKQIKVEKPKLPILILSMHKEEQYAVRSLKAGAAGYLSKDSASAQLVQAIRMVAGGGGFLSPEVAQKLALGMVQSSSAPPHTLLSDREFQIFQMIALGMGISEIANNLYLSVKTVSTHKTRLLQKMSLSNTSDLIRYAIKHQLIDDAEDFPDN